MKRHIENTRSKLGELSALSDKTEQTERNILAQAEKRLPEVQAAIDKMQAGIDGADDAEQDKYQELIAERGQLQIVIAKAKKILS